VHNSNGPIGYIKVRIKENTMNKKQRNTTLELWIGTLGFMIGGMLGLWMLIEIVKLGISK